MDNSHGTIKVGLDYSHGTIKVGGLGQHNSHGTIVGKGIRRSWRPVGKPPLLAPREARVSAREARKRRKRVRQEHVRRSRKAERKAERRRSVGGALAVFLVNGLKYQRVPGITAVLSCPCTPFWNSISQVFCRTE